MEHCTGRDPRIYSFMSAYKNFNVIRIGCSRPWPAWIFLVLSVLRDVQCDVCESERCLVSRRPFPGRKIFCSRRLAKSPDAKSGAVCAQISIHAPARQVFFFFAVPLIPIWDLESSAVTHDPRQRLT